MYRTCQYWVRSVWWQCISVPDLARRMEEEPVAVMPDLATRMEGELCRFGQCLQKHVDKLTNKL